MLSILSKDHWLKFKNGEENVPFKVYQIRLRDKFLFG